jgi:hypothetical protein
MAIVNRTLDPSEQYVEYSAKGGATANGVTSIVGIISSPCVLKGGQLAAFGVSGAPNYTVTVNRFITGTGFTAITLATGTSNTPPAYGTSGVTSTGLKIAAAGSTLLNLLANDVLIVLQGASSSDATTGWTLDLVVQPIQDIRSYFGIL